MAGETPARQSPGRRRYVRRSEIRLQTASRRNESGGFCFVARRRAECPSLRDHSEVTGMDARPSIVIHALHSLQTGRSLTTDP